VKFGRVIGQLVNSHSYDSLEGLPLKIVELLDDRGKAIGQTAIAGDRIGVGVGEYVFMEEAMEAGLGMANPLVPIDLGIVGRADHWTTRGERYQG
jgi:microcompartment protein CcmK/EutM